MVYLSYLFLAILLHPLVSGAPSTKLIISSIKMISKVILSSLLILLTLAGSSSDCYQHYSSPDDSSLDEPSTDQPPFATHLAADRDEVCLSSDSKKQPLVFDSFGVVYPTATCGSAGSGELFRGRSELYMACTGPRNKIMVGDEVIGTVAAVESLLSNKRGMDTRASCLTVNKAVIERDPHNDRNGECVAYRVGFRLPAGPSPRFHVVFVVCWVHSDNHPMWVRHVVNPAVAIDNDDEYGLVDRAIRAKFRFSRAVFGLDFNPKIYFTVAHQRKIGLLENNKGSDFLARGHLAPAGDFMLACERWATFRLENAVPQWQSHNNGEWKSVEDRARRVPGAHIIETGPVYGNDSSSGLFLSPRHKFLPVPKSLYKVVYNMDGLIIFNEVALITNALTGI
uniref:Wsv191-like protein n=1 Tax=Trachysalambria curvirostris nimavirus TaxID=2984282 RepID=A0A9C7EZ31_9VIRU|nr:MAG: wsv191-like protein [Trachysalambria curvirostris nimavirus]